MYTYERAKLDPEDLWLHKLRVTFATRCRELALICAAAVARSLRHRTMRYLRPSRSQQVRAKVNKIFA